MFNPWRKLEKENVVVQLLSGNAFAGVLREQGRNHLVLVNAVLYEPDSQPASVDGSVWLDRVNVDYIQRVRG